MFNLVFRGRSVKKSWWYRQPYMSNSTEKSICYRKISISVTNLPKGGNSWFFYGCKDVSILKFAMMKWHFRGTSFISVFLSLFFFWNIFLLFLSWKIFFILLFIHHIKWVNNISPSFRYCWKCKIDTQI